MCSLFGMVMSRYVIVGLIAIAYINHACKEIPDWQAMSTGS
jgi:hypothetical protein